MALFKDETLHKKIDDLADVNTTVSQMLAVHEERITKQETIDGVLFTKIDQLRDKMDVDHDSVLSRIHGLEKTVYCSRVCSGYNFFSISNSFINYLDNPTSSS